MSVRLTRYQSSDYSSEDADEFFSEEEEEEYIPRPKQRAQPRRKNAPYNIVNHGTMSDVANDYRDSNVVKGNVAYTYNYGKPAGQR